MERALAPPLRGMVCALVRMRDFLIINSRFLAHACSNKANLRTHKSLQAPWGMYAHRACRRTLAPTKPILELDNLRKPPGGGTRTARAGSRLLQQSQSWNSTISASPPRGRYAHRACRRTLAPTKPILELNNLCKPQGRYAHRACRRTLAPTKPILELTNFCKRYLWFLKKLFVFILR